MLVDLPCFFCKTNLKSALSLFIFHIFLCETAGFHWFFPSGPIIARQVDEVHLRHAAQGSTLTSSAKEGNILCKNFSVEVCFSHFFRQPKIAIIHVASQHSWEDYVYWNFFYLHRWNRLISFPGGNGSSFCQKCFGKSMISWPWTHRIVVPQLRSMMDKSFCYRGRKAAMVQRATKSHGTPIYLGRKRRRWKTTPIFVWSMTMMSICVSSKVVVVDFVWLIGLCIVCSVG